MKKAILLGLPLVLICPLLLLMLGMGNANIEAVRAACAATANSVGGSFSIFEPGELDNSFRPSRDKRP